MAWETLMAVVVTVIVAVILGIVLSRLFYRLTKKNRFTSLLLSIVFVIIATPVSIAIGMAVTIALAKISPVFALPCTSYAECFGKAFLNMFLMGLFGVLAYIITILVVFFVRIKK